MRPLRLLLASLLAVSTVPLSSFAQEDAGDLTESANPLCRCVAREIAAADAEYPASEEASDVDASEEAAAVAPARRVPLAQTQARLIALARGLEFFRNVGHYDNPDMKRTLAKIVPKDYLPHFSTRRRALYSTYRTLAVVDSAQAKGRVLRAERNEAGDDHPQGRAQEDSAHDSACGRQIERAKCASSNH